MKSSPMGIKIIFMVFLVLTFLAPINVFAESPFYIVIKPGIYFPQSSNLDGFDTGFSGEAGLGYRFNPNIAAEIGIGYLHTEGEKKGGGATDVSREFHINGFPVTFTLKAILPYKKWEFIGLGGAGVYIVSIPHDVDDHDRDHRAYHDHYYDHADDYHYDARLGVYLGAGINYNITRRIFLGVEGKYLWTNKVKVEYEESGAHREVEFRMDGIIATAVIGIRF